MNRRRNKSTLKVTALSGNRAKKYYSNLVFDSPLPPMTTYSYVYSKRALQRKQKAVSQAIKNAENMMLQELKTD